MKKNADTDFVLLVFIKLVPGGSGVREGRHLQAGQTQAGRGQGLNFTDFSNISKSYFQGPGIFFVIPCIDHFRCVDLRTVSFDVPPQEVKYSVMAIQNNLFLYKTN